MKKTKNKKKNTIMTSRFKWNVKPYFLWKNKKINFQMLSATNLLSALKISKLQQMTF